MANWILLYSGNVDVCNHLDLSVPDSRQDRPPTSRETKLELPPKAGDLDSNRSADVALAVAVMCRGVVIVGRFAGPYSSSSASSVNFLPSGKRGQEKSGAGTGGSPAPAVFMIPVGMWQGCKEQACQEASTSAE